MSNLFEQLASITKPVTAEIPMDKVLEEANKANAYGYPSKTREKRDAFNDGFIEGAKWQANQYKP